MILFLLPEHVRHGRGSLGECRGIDFRGRGFGCQTLGTRPHLPLETGVFFASVEVMLVVPYHEDVHKRCWSPHIWRYFCLVALFGCGMDALESHQQGQASAVEAPIAPPSWEQVWEEDQLYTVRPVVLIPHQAQGEETDYLRQHLLSALQDVQCFYAAHNDGRTFTFASPRFEVLEEGQTLEDLGFETSGERGFNDIYWERGGQEQLATSGALPSMTS